MTYRGRHRQVAEGQKRLRRIGTVAALTGLTVAFATPAYAADVVGIPTVEVNYTSWEEAAAAAGRLVDGLVPFATGQAGQAAATLQDEATRALALAQEQEIEIQGTDTSQDIAMILGIGGAAVIKAQQMAAQVQAMADAAVGDLTDQINDLDVARLMDDAINLVNFYTTGYLHPCATVSHDILRVGSPQAFAPTTDDVPQPNELDVAGLVGTATGMTATLSDCLPEGFVSSDGGVEVSGQVVSRPIGMPGFGDDGNSQANNCNGCGGPGPSTFDDVSSRDVGRGDYGGYYVYSDGMRDGSSVFATYRFYRPNYRDKYGDTIIAWQSATGSIKEHTNLKKLETHIVPESPSAARFEDYTPQGQNEYEGATPVSANLNFGLVPGDSGGGSVNVGVSRQFGVSHTKFGGDMEFDGRTVYAVRGGYRHIAQGHRNMSRAYSHAAAWTFPSGVSEMFYFTMDQYAYRR